MYIEKIPQYKGKKHLYPIVDKVIPGYYNNNNNNNNSALLRHPVQDINPEVFSFDPSYIKYNEIPPPSCQSSYEDHIPQSSTRIDPMSISKQYMTDNNTNCFNMRTIFLKRDYITFEYGLLLIWTAFGIIIFCNHKDSRLIKSGIRNFDRLLFINDQPVTSLNKQKIKILLKNSPSIKLIVTDHPLVQFYNIEKQNPHDTIGFTVVNGNYISEVVPYSLAARCGILENYVILSCNDIEIWDNNKDIQPSRLSSIVRKSNRLTLKTIPSFAFSCYISKFR